MSKIHYKREPLIQIIPPTGFVRGTKYKLPDRQEVREL
jgi:hypothetical protein